MSMTINKKLLLIIIPVFIFTIGSYLTYEVYTSIVSYEKDFDKSIETAISVLSPSLKSNIYNLEKFSARNTIKGIFTDENVKIALSFSENKSFFTGIEKNEKNQFQNIDSGINLDNYLTNIDVFKEKQFYVYSLSDYDRRFVYPLWTTLADNKQKALDGFFVVEASTKNLRDRIFLMIFRLILGLVSCIVFSIFCIYIFLQFQLIKPIVRLMQAIQNIADGKFEKLPNSFDRNLDPSNIHNHKDIQNNNSKQSVMNDSFIVKKSDPFEIKLLGNAFNKMVVKLVESRKAIDAINQNLEHLVEEKTAKLSETLNKLKENQATMVHLAKLTSLGEMAGGIAHEINNPLTIISGNVYSIMKMVNSSVIDINLFKQYISTINMTIQRISKITQGLLTFSRKEEAQDFNTEYLKDIIEQTTILCSEKFKNDGIDLNIEILNQELTVECQPIQISQVLLNLLNNSCYAIKALEKRWIHIKAVDLDKFIEIQVTDSGDGIPPKIRDKIMQPFFTSKKIGEGTGLGLSVSVGIIRMHGGELSINNDCPNTQFIIRLPKMQIYRTDNPII